MGGGLTVVKIYILLNLETSKRSADRGMHTHRVVPFLGGLDPTEKAPLSRTSTHDAVSNFLAERAIAMTWHLIAALSGIR